jgi:hypothetical protein
MLSLFRVLSQSERKAERLSGSSGLSERVPQLVLSLKKNQCYSMFTYVHTCSREHQISAARTVSFRFHSFSLSCDVRCNHEMFQVSRLYALMINFAVLERKLKENN